MAGRETTATRLLREHRVPYEVYEYPHEPRRGDYGDEAVEALGVAPARVFKTLVAEVDGALAVGVLPVATRLDLKGLARALGGKRARMAEVAAAERATGYVAGGIAPLGHRTRIPVVLDASAARHTTIYCSAGRRGLEIEVAPEDLVRLATASLAPIGI